MGGAGGLGGEAAQGVAVAGCVNGAALGDDSVFSIFQSIWNLDGAVWISATVPGVMPTS